MKRISLFTYAVIAMNLYAAISFWFMNAEMDRFWVGVEYALAAGFVYFAAYWRSRALYTEQLIKEAVDGHRPARPDLNS